VKHYDKIGKKKMQQKFKKIVYNIGMPHKKQEDAFYSLDNSAIFMAAITGASGPFVFRFYCELDAPVVVPALQDAVDALFPRFPYFFVRLRRGVFWHYLDPVSKPPRVEKELVYPCAPMPRGPDRPAVRIFAYGRRISVEFQHVITDGTGAIAFMRALTVEYLRNIGIGTDVEDRMLIEAGIKHPREPVESEEAEDGYNKYFRPTATVPDKTGQAFTIPGFRMLIAFRETLGSMDVQQVLAVAKGFKVSLTEFLTALHIEVLQDMYEALPRREQKKAKKIISVQVPVNLRKIYPSKSLRNFFLFVAPYIDVRLGHWTFEEILRRVHHQMQLGLEEKELVRQLKRNVGGERNPLGKIVFLPIKTLVLRIINAIIGVGAYSGSLSNVGIIDLPEPFASHVIRYSFIPSRARTTGANVGALTWQNRLYINIGSMVRGKNFEKRFFSKLSSFGIDVFVISSQNEGDFNL
jgi:NRPS condensation-like uncharacterized protein